MASADKTEAPTPKKKREARRDGNIPKSPDLSSWAGVLTATYVIPFVAASAMAMQRNLLMKMQDGITHPSEAAALDMLSAGGRGAVITVAPLLAAMVAVGLATNLAQTRGSTSFHRIKPKPGKLNPLKGIKRLVSPQSGYQAGKTIVKAGILLAVAWHPLEDTTKQLAGLGDADLMTTLPLVGRNCLSLVRTVAWAGLLIGAIDYVVQRRKVGKGLKMTKQEVRDEARMSEGDPMIKQKLKQRMLQISQNRMMAAVSRANVVIVNPIHVAVALTYEPGAGAPTVVAKGMGGVALKIRDEAMKHNVPVVKEIDLAWALHDVCELDHPVPANLFEAVARVLAFVLTVGQRVAAYGYVQTLPGTEGQREPIAGSRPPRVRKERPTRVG